MYTCIHARKCFLVGNESKVIKDEVTTVTEESRLIKDEVISANEDGRGKWSSMDIKTDVKVEDKDRSPSRFVFILLLVSSLI